MEPPQPLFIECIIDSVSCLDEGLPYDYAGDDVYINLIQQWIEQSCSGAYHPWHDFGVLSNVHGSN